MPPPERRLIIDATFPWRIARELVARGFIDATSPHQLGDQKIKDPPLLKLVFDTLEPATLVTYDNKMAVEHEALLVKYETTLAVIDKHGRPDHLTPEQYWRDVIHRHAHSLPLSPPGAAASTDNEAGDQSASRILGVSRNESRGTDDQATPAIPHHYRSSEFR